MNNLHLLAASTLCLLALACGDDGDDKGGGSTGGVSDSATLSSLSPSDQTKVCKSLQTKLSGVEEDTAKLTCTLQGVFVGQGDEAACTTARDSCLKEPAEPSENTDLGCDTQNGELEACDDVTVGELNDCVEALSAALRDFSGKLTCSSKPAELDASQEFASPAACTKLEARCPAFADMDMP